MNRHTRRSGELVYPSCVESHFWLGRNGGGKNHEKVANIAVFVFCCCADLLSEWLQKTQVFPVYPIKELLMLLLHNTSTIFILVPLYNNTCLTVMLQKPFTCSTVLNVCIDKYYSGTPLLRDHHCVSGL